MITVAIKDMDIDMDMDTDMDIDMEENGVKMTIISDQPTDNNYIKNYTIYLYHN